MYKGLQSLTRAYKNIFIIFIVFIVSITNMNKAYIVALMLRAYNNILAARLPRINSTLFFQNTHCVVPCGTLLFALIRIRSL